MITGHQTDVWTGSGAFFFDSFPIRCNPDFLLCNLRTESVRYFVIGAGQQSFIWAALEKGIKKTGAIGNKIIAVFEQSIIGQFQKIRTLTGEPVIGQIRLVARDETACFPLNNRLKQNTMSVRALLIRSFIPDMVSIISIR